jgi:hypothetical protein
MILPLATCRLPLEQQATGNNPHITNMGLPLATCESPQIKGLASGRLGEVVATCNGTNRATPELPPKNKKQPQIT